MTGNGHHDPSKVIGDFPGGWCHHGIGLPTPSLLGPKDALDGEPSDVTSASESTTCFFAGSMLAF